jgi:RNA-directed DNA polymerase
VTETLLELMSAEFGIGQLELVRIVVTAPLRYKVFQIAKRSGGMRTIAQPSRELKAIQRFVMSRYLDHLPVHRAAAGYVVGRNILENAQVHRKNRVLLKLDFKDFFPSILVRDWEEYVIKNNLELSGYDRDALSKILFWGQRSGQPKCLSIGAPTSPMLSNILLFDLDERLSKVATNANVKYSRYADDITASGTQIEDLLRFESEIRQIVGSTSSPRLIFNDEKRGVFTPRLRRMVTGLVITPEGRVSLGRQRKRQISAMLHHASIGKITSDRMARLKGLLGFSIANEPDFVSHMRNKYGSETMDRVLRYQIPKRRKGPSTK